MRWTHAPEGAAYWAEVEAAHRQHGLPSPDHEPPRPDERNVLAWLCWGLVYPDCRERTMGGAGFLDWGKVADVIQTFHGIEPTGDLHRRLRCCIFEVLQIEHEVRGRDGKG